jgi:ribonuclease HI
MTNLREFDPNKYDWVWNVLPTDILVENNRGTYTNIQRPDGRCARNTIAVYIDGACSGNGRPWARASYGVYFGSGSNFNTSGVLDDDERHTAERAELKAAVEALSLIQQLNQKHQDMQHFVVICDSQYVVSGISECTERWKLNGWANSKGKEIANQDLWTQLDTLCFDHERDIGTVAFWRVDRKRNEEADALARSALA